MKSAHLPTSNVSRFLNPRQFAASPVAETIIAWGLAQLLSSAPFPNAQNNLEPARRARICTESDINPCVSQNVQISVLQLLMLVYTSGHFDFLLLFAVVQDL